MAASTNIIRAAKKAMFTAIQQDYKSVVAKLGKVREPRLEIIVAANDSQSLELVCMKQKLLDKAGFKSTVKLLDNGMDLGRSV